MILGRRAAERDPMRAKEATSQLANGGHQSRALKYGSDNTKFDPYSTAALY
jgi:hypothetical protein